MRVSPGETVRFLFSDKGKVAHDAVVGDTAAQDEHEDEMRDATAHGEGSGMGGVGHGTEPEGDEAAITVDPGMTGELRHTFGSADSVLIGCHEPGHYAAGMKLTLDMAS